MLTDVKQKLAQKNAFLFWGSVLGLTLINPFLLASGLKWRAAGLLIALLIAPRFGATRFFLLILLYLMALYGVVGASHGALNYSLIASLMDTHWQETQEFLPTIPLKNWGLAILAVALTFLYQRQSRFFVGKFWGRLAGKFEEKFGDQTQTGQDCDFDAQNSQNSQKLQKVKKFVQHGVLILLFIAGVGSAFTQKFLKSITNVPIRYYQYSQELKRLATLPDDWKIEARLPNYQAYQNYVVVIGESVRQDYLSVYGYRHATTPFLNRRSGVFFRQMYAMGGNTVSSLSRTLSRVVGDGSEIVPADNVVTLANKAGYETVWISNQGRLSKFDLSTSAVALSADQVMFLKQGKYDDTNYDDEILLTRLEEVLVRRHSQNSQNSSGKSTVFFLHMHGSHPDVCERLHGFAQNFHLGYGQAVDCYLASLQKTDAFLAHLDGLLGRFGSYSLVYFSDHGLSVSEAGVYHDAHLASSYRVPFLKLSSDDERQVFVDRPLSQRHFLDFYANWLGVKTNHTDGRFAFEAGAGQADLGNALPSVFDGQKMVQVETLPKQAPLE